MIDVESDRTNVSKTKTGTEPRRPPYHGSTTLNRSNRDETVVKQFKDNASSRFNQSNRPVLFGFKNIG